MPYRCMAVPQLCRTAGLRTLEKGEWLWHQGQASSEMCVLLSGTLSVWAAPQGTLDFAPTVDSG